MEYHGTFDGIGSNANIRVIEGLEVFKA